MYTPSHFARTDLPSLHALIEARPLGTWITQDEQSLIVNHVPFLLDAQRGPLGTLVGHVARANPVWRTTAALKSIVVFHGPQAYVSPRAYPSKQRDPRVVPTWNYIVVHAHGRAAVLHDRDRLLQIVTQLTQTHEIPGEHAWHVSDAPAEYVEKLLGAIVGIEIPIEHLEGKWKISQNRSRADQAGVAELLQTSRSSEEREMAEFLLGNAEDR